MQSVSEGLARLELRARQHRAEHMIRTSLSRRSLHPCRTASRRDLFIFGRAATVLFSQRLDLYCSPHDFRQSFLL